MSTELKIKYNQKKYVFNWEFVPNINWAYAETRGGSRILKRGWFNFKKEGFFSFLSCYRYLTLKNAMLFWCWASVQKEKTKQNETTKDGPASKQHQGSKRPRCCFNAEPVSQTSKQHCLNVSCLLTKKHQDLTINMMIENMMINNAYKIKRRRSLSINIASFTRTRRYYIDTGAIWCYCFNNPTLSHHAFQFNSISFFSIQNVFFVSTNEV